MDIFEAIKTRHSVRKFTDEVPPVEDVEKIINAARLAPSSTNAQMWHYMVIYNPETKAKMKQAIAETYDEMLTWKESEEHADALKHYKEYSTFFTDAPVNIAVLMEPKSSIIEETLRAKGVSEEEIRRCRPNPSLLSVGASIENLSLAAHALGYGTCWLTAPIYAYKKLEQVLNVKPCYQLVSFLCLGKPFCEKPMIKPKKSLSEILTWVLSVAIVLLCTVSLPAFSAENDVKTEIFYINDIHSQLRGIERIQTAGDVFSASMENKPSTDGFKLTGGDIHIATNKAKNRLITKFMNGMGLDASAIGNHELDDGFSELQKYSTSANFPYVATNVKILKPTKIVRSCIITKNEHPYGFVGAMPVDLKQRISKKVDTTNIIIDNFDETVKDIQAEVCNLEKQGVDRIILVSHLGYDVDVKVAQKVSGVDVIIGGHSHDLIRGILQGVNLVQSPKNEPVLVVQAGKDGDYFGILDVVFQEDGTIKSATNSVMKSDTFSPSPLIAEMEDKYLGKAQDIGILSNNPKKLESVETFAADAMRYVSGSQIAFVNGGLIRGNLRAGTISTRDIHELIPFDNRVYKVELSEKAIIDALNQGAKSTLQPHPIPGLLRVSGLRYDVTLFKTVENVYVKNKNGSLTRLNHISPDPKRMFTVSYSDFLLEGSGGLEMLAKPAKVLESRRLKCSDAIIEYVKSFNNKPFEI